MVQQNSKVMVPLNANIRWKKQWIEILKNGVINKRIYHADFDQFVKRGGELDQMFTDQRDLNIFKQDKS